MADILSTLKALGGNRLKIWLDKPESQESLKQATMEVKAYALEKWAVGFPGAPFPFNLYTDGPEQPDNPAPQEASQADAPQPETQAPTDRQRPNTAAYDSGEPLLSVQREKTPAVLMTEQQRFISNMVAAAAEEAPVIENVVELKTQLQMLVPKPIKESRKDYTYKWTDVGNLQADLYKYGGIWEIVTRSNHPHLSEHFFGDEGAIVYKGRSVLTFTRKSITDQLEKETIRQFNFKADAALKNLDKGYGMVRGKEAIRLTISDQQPQEPEVGSEDLTIAENGKGDYYDYGDTGSPI